MSRQQLPGFCISSEIVIMTYCVNVFVSSAAAFSIAPGFEALEHLVEALTRCAINTGNSHFIVGKYARPISVNHRIEHPTLTDD